MNDKISKLKFKLSILSSNTTGVVCAMIKGKKVMSMSNAYMEYLDNYLYSPNGANLSFEDTMPLYGEHSFKNWVARNNYHIKLTSNIDFEREQKAFLGLTWSVFDKYVVNKKRKREFV